MYIWGLGLLASGQSSTLTGTMAGQFVMEGFVKIKISRVKFFIKFYRSLITRSIAIVPSICIALLGNTDDLL